ncbi:MAG: xanthine dehydrogenase family protein molybdopterin-binding subunit [Defluviicoccus sp.]|nr:xanthine dehydrogenase family protein molybdopterin-binding subunit [Defluviicoccus sp.]MDE0382788.1 xanthine dehydrogenase family protein molybdopterin-binding subunit [Defluviicoccus sp.]
MTGAGDPLGKPLARIEDRPLVTGRGRYAADIDFPGQLHMRVVRSPHAHAELLGVDAEAALAVAGVRAVWSAADIAGIPPIDFRADRQVAALKPYRQHVLARDRVRYVGEPVAAVFAETPYIAEDAAELVGLDLEPLPAIVAADAEEGEFAPGLGTEAVLLTHTFGDAASGFARAHAVVSLDLATGRHSGVPMETRGAIGVYDEARDRLALHGAAKVPHRNKETLTRMLGLAPERIHLYESHVGGGFGIRGELYPEDVLVLLAAKRLGSPVKWIEDRQEHLTAANQGREQRHLARLAVDEDGRILALEDEIWHDQGAYLRTHGVSVPNRTMCSLPGLYRVPAFRASCHVRLTNKAPAATYRAPGRFESSFVRERLMDAAADRLGIDRVEIRRRNLIPAADLPCTIAYDEPYAETLALDSGDYELLLQKALDAVGWDDLRADLARRRQAGELVGAGVATFLEESGRGPSDGARIAVDAAGGIEVVTGGASVGQGFETAMAQICAAALGVDYRRVAVVHGQTDRIPYGIGAHAARATVLTGSAVHATALAVREKALAAAAELLQTPAERLAIRDGVVRAGEGGPSIPLGGIVRARGSDALAAEAFYETAQCTFPYGAHIAVVRVDPGTGDVTVERFLIAYDVGRAVNPAMLEGQLVGGCVQGIGGALHEAFVYDAAGQPLAVTLADYKLPTVAEVPAIACLVTEDAPSPRNPLGIKGGGEGGINGVAAAIASAVDEAIGIEGAIDRTPIAPERVRALLRGRTQR